MTCRSKKPSLDPIDITMIVGGKAFKQWKLTLRDSLTLESIPVVGDLQKGDFQRGKLTEEAVNRIMGEIIRHLKNAGQSLTEKNEMMIIHYLVRY